MALDPVEIVFPVAAKSEITGESESEAIFSYHAGPVKVPGPWRRGRPRGDKSKQGTVRSRDDRERTMSQSEPLEFIHLSPSTRSIDVHSKDRIRSHARRNALLKISELSNEMDYKRRRVSSAVAGLSVSGFVHHYNIRQIDGVDPFNTLPIQFEPYMHDLLVSLSTTVWKTLYTLEWAVGFNPFIEYGLPLGFADPALMHTFISCADTFLCYFARNNNSALSLWHLNRAISIVNKRISETTVQGNQNTSGQIDASTIIMVAGIAMFERGRDRPENWKLHMEGLKQLVHCYGGIERVYEQPYVIQKIFRADLYGSLESDQPTYFDGNSACSLLIGPLSPGPAPGLSHTFYNDGFGHLLATCSQNPLLSRCLSQIDEAVFLCQKYCTPSAKRHSKELYRGNSNMNSQRAATATRIRYLLTGAQYSLLSDALRQYIATTPSVFERHMQEICRIALLFFSLTTLKEMPPKTHYGLQLAFKLNHMLGASSEIETSMAVMQVQDLYLWAIITAATVVATDATAVQDSTSSICRSKLQGHFSAIISGHPGNEEMGILGWRVRICQFPWVAEEYDDTLRRLHDTMIGR